jgi:hypothetical protein
MARRTASGLFRGSPAAVSGLPARQMHRERLAAPATTAAARLEMATRNRERRSRPHKSRRPPRRRGGCSVSGPWHDVGSESALRDPGQRRLGSEYLRRTTGQRAIREGDEPACRDRLPHARFVATCASSKLTLAQSDQATLLPASTRNTSSKRRKARDAVVAVSRTGLRMPFFSMRPIVVMLTPQRAARSARVMRVRAR